MSKQLLGIPLMESQRFCCVGKGSEGDAGRGVRGHANFDLIFFNKIPWAADK